MEIFDQQNILNEKTFRVLVCVSAAETGVCVSGSPPDELGCTNSGGRFENQNSFQNKQKTNREDLIANVNNRESATCGDNEFGWRNRCTKRVGLR